MEETDPVALLPKVVGLLFIQARRLTQPTFSSSNKVSNHLKVIVVLTVYHTYSKTCIGGDSAVTWVSTYLQVHNKALQAPGRAVTAAVALLEVCSWVEQFGWIHVLQCFEYALSTLTMQ